MYLYKRIFINIFCANIFIRTLYVVYLLDKTTFYYFNLFIELLLIDIKNINNTAYY